MLIIGEHLKDTSFFCIQLVGYVDMFVCVTDERMRTTSLRDVNSSGYLNELNK